MGKFWVNLFYFYSTIWSHCLGSMLAGLLRPQLTSPKVDARFWRFWGSNLCDNFSSISVQTHLKDTEPKSQLGKDDQTKQTFRLRTGQWRCLFPDWRSVSIFYFRYCPACLLRSHDDDDKEDQIRREGNFSISSLGTIDLIWCIEIVAKKIIDYKRLMGYASKPVRPDFDKFSQFGHFLTVLFRIRQKI